MWYRHNLIFHNGIAASFVFELSPENVNYGHDDDGKVVIETADVAPFQERIDAVNHAYPNTYRDSLYDDMWKAAEAQFVQKGFSVAGRALIPFSPFVHEYKETEAA